MNSSKLSGPGPTEVELQEAIKQLAASIRQAGECLLDLQEAIVALQMAKDPGFARRIDCTARATLREAMRK